MSFFLFRYILNTVFFCTFENRNKLDFLPILMFRLHLVKLILIN